MITVSEAKAIIDQTIQDYGTEQVLTSLCLGRVLREDLYADRDFPPFNRVAMDGIAIHADSFGKGQREFPIAGIAPAGTPQQTMEDIKACMEVMTGCVLPLGTNAVVRYEDIQTKDGKATIVIDDVPAWKHVHIQGLDRKQGDLLISKGKIITGAELGVAATIGKTHLKVSKLPRVAVISTGDELVKISETPLPHQIRRSNIFRLQSSLQQLGVPATIFHLTDEYEAIRLELINILKTYDVLVLSGGVSMGKFDHLPKVFESLKVNKGFHKIKQRPGKPLWFGQSQEGAVIFALPGNPVSSFMCTQAYVLPWVRACLQTPPAPKRYACLAVDYYFKPDLDYFLQVKLAYTSGGLTVATPVVGHGSGDLANLVDAGAFLHLPRGINDFKEGDAFEYIKW